MRGRRSFIDEPAAAEWPVTFSQPSLWNYVMHLSFHFSMCISIIFVVCKYFMRFSLFSKISLISFSSMTFLIDFMLLLLFISFIFISPFSPDSDERWLRWCFDIDEILFRVFSLFRGRHYWLFRCIFIFIIDVKITPWLFLQTFHAYELMHYLLFSSFHYGHFDIATFRWLFRCERRITR